MSDRDSFIKFEDILQPDVRNSSFVLVDTQAATSCPITLEDHYAAIAKFPVSDQVPEKVATQYDVARNLYIYAWYEYRFFPVSEMQALVAFEFGLRERIGKAALKSYIKDRKKKHYEATGKNIRLSDGLKTLVEFCRDNKLVKNEQFSAWYRQPRKDAEWARDIELFEKMEREGLDEIIVDYSDLEYPESDDSYDHIQHLVDQVNKRRNAYTHGSSDLHRNVLETFEMVSEFLNAVYEDA